MKENRTNIAIAMLCREMYIEGIKLLQSGTEWYVIQNILEFLDNIKEIYYEIQEFGDGFSFNWYIDNIDNILYFWIGSADYRKIIIHNKE